MTHKKWLPGPGQLTLLPEVAAPAARSPARRRQAAPLRVPTTSTRVQPARPSTRPHGPTRARQQSGPGELHGAAPTKRQVKHVHLVVEQLDNGRWRFTMPRAPGAAWVASRPVEVAQSVRAAFGEAQIAAYSDWKGFAYDAALPTYKRHKPTARSRKRCDVYAPEMWARDPNDPAIWISPKGLHFREDRQVVQRVIEQMEKQGIPVERALPKPQSRPQPGSVTSMTARRVQTASHQQRRGRTA